jgi:hypothetical protein
MSDIPQRELRNEINRVLRAAACDAASTVTADDLAGLEDEVDWHLA